MHKHRLMMSTLLFNLSSRLYELAFICVGAICAGMTTRFSVRPVPLATTTVAARNKEGVKDGHDQSHKGNEVENSAQRHSCKSHGVESAIGR